MRKKGIIIGAVVIVLLAVAGTIFYSMKGTNHTANTSKSEQSITQKIDKLSMKQVASLTIVYAHLKYRKNPSWQKIYQNAKEKNVKIQKYHQYKFLNYSAKAKNGECVYVIQKQVVFAISDQKKKSNAVIAIGDDEHALGSPKLINIYQKIFNNKQNKKEYNQVLNNIDLNSAISVQKEKKTDTKNNTSTQEAASKIAGDGGEYLIPSAMQGTWYTVEKSYDDDFNETTDSSNAVISMTLKGNTISNIGGSEDGNNVWQLHKVDPSTFPKDMMVNWPEDYTKQVQNWFKANSFSDKGFVGFHTYGWGQSAGAGNYFYLTHENGQTVLILASGAGAWTDYIYWKSPELAKKYAGQKFDNLDYND